MNKKGLHLVGRDICSPPLPLTIVFSNVILRCRNQMDNEPICLKRVSLPENVFPSHWMGDVFVFVRLLCVCFTSKWNDTGIINHTSDSRPLQAFAYCQGR